jgi:hypothetical protein
MVQSNLIWIPSLQDFKRFLEITTKDHRILSKSMNNDLEFIYSLNQLIKEKSIDDIVVDDLTLIDKYIICLYLRIFSIGNDLTLTINCPSCGASFKHIMDINEFMESGIDVLDKKYEGTAEINGFSANLGIPTIGREYDIIKHLELHKIKKQSLDGILTYNVISHIKSISIRDNEINFNDISVDNSIDILKRLPGSLFNKIKNEFITPISKSINPKILNLECKTPKCSPIDLELNLDNINDLLRLMFQESPVKILEEIYLLGRYGNTDPFYIDTLTPLERGIVVDAHITENKSGETKKEDPMTIGNMTDMGF